MHGLLDAAFALGIHRSALANRVRHIGDALLVEAQQADFVDVFGEKHVHQTLVLARHNEHMRCFLQQILGERLASEFRQVYALGGEDIHRIAAGWGSLRGAESG